MASVLNILFSCMKLSLTYVCTVKLVQAHFLADDMCVFCLRLVLRGPALGLSSFSVSFTPRTLPVSYSYKNWWEGEAGFSRWVCYFTAAKLGVELKRCGYNDNIGNRQTNSKRLAVGDSCWCG